MMNCPRCKIPLITETIKDVNRSIEVERCSTCGGTWFDKGGLSQVDKIIEPVFLEIRKIPKKTEQMQALNCPSCNNLQLLQKAEHPMDTHVIIDYCPNCKGIWLDKGELDAIQKENVLITVGKIFRWLIGKDE